MAEELGKNDEVAVATVQGKSSTPATGRSYGGFAPAMGEQSCLRLESDERDPDMTAAWSVPWSDFMMVMFILFAVLLAVEMQDGDVAEMFATAETELQPQLEATAAEAAYPLAPAKEPDPTADTKEAPTPERILRESREAVINANLDTVDVALTENKAIRVSVRGPMFFDLGKADLKPSAARFLQGLATVIQRNPFVIQVVGHTDDFPINTERFPSNWELSVTRATVVARYLIARGGINPARFTVMGHAKHRPVVPNDTLENKALNRRVEIIITREEAPVQGERAQ